MKVGTFWQEKRINWSQDRERVHRGDARDGEKSSYEEHRVDAQAPYAEEGRGKLRKAAGSRKQASIRRYPNGGTRREERPVTVS